MQQLQELVETLESQEKIKKDYLSSNDNLLFLDGNLVLTHADQRVTFAPSTLFHSQVSEKLGIPKGYYDKMKEKALYLLDDNVNHWLQAESKNLLIRTFQDGEHNTARAFLSDRYNMIDNVQVLFEALQSIKDAGVHVDVVGAELSDTRMYLKVVCPEVEVKATEMLKLYRRTYDVGTGVISGFILQNSEVGCGTFQIAPRAVVLACNNGMVKTDDNLRRVHLGAKMDELEFYKNEAVRNANRKLVQEQVKHAVKRFLSKDYLQRLVDKFTLLGDKKIEAPINSVVEVVAKNYAIGETHKKSILDHFIRGGDDRRIGIVNAITEVTQTMEDIDQRNETEAITYDLLTKFDRIEAAAIKFDQSSN